MSTALNRELIDNIPTILKQYPYINWFIKIVDGKLTKCPTCDITDPINWMQFDTALKQSDKVGIVLNEQSCLTSNVMLACVDFDKVVDSPFEEEVLKLKENAWIERSVSGAGYHAFIQVVASDFIGKKFKTRFANELGKFELYFNKRFIATTFNHLEGSQFNEIFKLTELEQLLSIQLVDTPIQAIAFDNYDTSNSNISILERANYTDSGDASKDVFNFVVSVVGFCRNQDHVLECFHASKLAIGKYSVDGGDKLKRTLKYLLQDIDVDKERIRVDPVSVFEVLEDDEDEDEDEDEVLEIRWRYRNLLEDTYKCKGEIRRCIFDGSAYITTETGELLSIESQDVLSKVKDECRIRNSNITNKRKKLKQLEVSDAMTAFKCSLDPELLLDIKPYDNVDRIRHLSGLLNFQDKRFTSEVFEYFSKDWLVKCIHKVMTGKGTNRMLVLQGSQGAGKDSFLSMLIGGWKSYQREISAPSKFDGEKQLFEQCAKMAVGSLRELDKFDPIALKRLIDANKFSYRPSFGREVVDYVNRTSFVASCNPRNPFIDETGNRRFLFFGLEGIPDTQIARTKYPSLPIAIKWEFDDQDDYYKAQVLAQAFHLWRENGEKPLPVNNKYELLMASVMEELTPEISGSEIVEDFDALLVSENKKRLSHGNKLRLYTRPELLELPTFQKLCNVNEMKMKTFLSEIARTEDRRHRENEKKYVKNRTYYHLPGDWTEEQRQFTVTPCTFDEIPF